MVEELDRQNRPADIEELGTGKLALAMREGDTAMGSLMAGQAAALVCKIEPAADIVNEIITEATAVMGRMAVVARGV